MSKSTLKLAEEISDEFLGSGVTSGKIWVNYNDLGYDKALESLKKAEGLTKFAYEEERIEEILKRVIEKKEATLAVQNLKKYREDLLKMAKEEKRMHKEPLQKFLLQVNIIKNLLKKDAQIEQALSVVASDLASLISILPKGDE